MLVCLLKVAPFDKKKNETGDVWLGQVGADMNSQLGQEDSFNLPVDFCWIPRQVKLENFFEIRLTKSNASNHTAMPLRSHPVLISIRRVHRLRLSPAVITMIIILSLAHEVSLSSIFTMGACSTNLSSLMTFGAPIRRANPLMTVHMLMLAGNASTSGMISAVEQG